MPQIGIVMGSDRDLPHMEKAARFLRNLDIPFEMTALSAYRCPDRVREYGLSALGRGFEVVIAASGGTNELACLIASYTTLPVIGVPLRTDEGEASVSRELAALLSTLETPAGIPVATVGFNAVINAACLAVQILGVKDKRVRARLEEYRESRRAEETEKARRVEEAAREHHV
ncbi:MAG: AIR carboxylase family protein [Armatimonadetes bacterium]|nr:AIR carboxylase family protein [Armatimonadota bacterium]